MSTDKQGKSGLDLDAQKAAVADRLDGGRWQIVESSPRLKAGNVFHGFNLMQLFPLARSTRRS